jgi:circadian clock protein KaiC
MSPPNPSTGAGMRVINLRGGTHLEGKHTLHLSLDGFTVFPHIETLIPATMPVSPAAGRAASPACGTSPAAGSPATTAG